MNKRIALEEEMRLKKQRWLVEEQMQHVQEEHESRTDALSGRKIKEQVDVDDDEIEEGKPKLPKRKQKIKQN
ncbi:hypothetical protein TNCV_144781 [Trichonephila clavipes]|nr:hypothetical protein TNCV_144781 [Trichonephila clavipes]